VQLVAVNELTAYVMVGSGEPSVADDVAVEPPGSEYGDAVASSDVTDGDQVTVCGARAKVKV
jgi:hypothetical protein